MQSNFFETLPFILSETERRAIIQKTERLFLERIDTKISDHSRREQLFTFQLWVFCLDHYFEQNQILEPDVLKKIWGQGYKILQQFGLTPEESKKLLSETEKYAAIESGLRSGAELTDIPIKKFYFYKSCDVRMQRHLSQHLKTKSYQSSELDIALDILQEIEDDVDDLEEDMNTPINGNRLLHGITADKNAFIKQYMDYVTKHHDAFPELTDRLLSKLRAI